MKRRTLLLASLLFAAAIVRAQDWPVATPESQGMDPAALALLVDYGGNAGMNSLVVARHGRIVLEAYWAPFRGAMLHRMNSATKAVVGTLTGIAIAQGKLPPPATKLPQLFPAVASSADARWQQITVQDLLDMRSGIAWDESLAARAMPRSALEMERSANWVDFVLARPMAQAPGTRFDYNSGNPQLLSAALMKATGQATEAYAREVLFAPLGITDLRWRKDPQGVAIGGFGLYLRTRDMARLGQLYLQHGEWNGRQVVPRAWADRVFDPHVDMDAPGYRYADFWWSIPGKGAYMMVGFNRQLVLVMPELDLVAATTARANYPIEDLVAHLRSAARSPAALPENAEAQRLLRVQVEAAARARPMPEGSGAPATLPQGTYRLQDNPGGVRELAFDFAASPPAYRMRLRSREIVAPLGADGQFAEIDDAGTPLFTRAAWRDADTLLVEQRWPEEGAAVRYVVKFEGDALDITRINERGERAQVQGRRLR